MWQLLSMVELIILLAVYSYLITHVIPKRFYTISNLIFSILIVIYALAVAELSAFDVGLAPSKMITGLIWGILASLPLMVIMPILLWQKRLHNLFTHKTSRAPNKISTLLELGIRLPFGTALSEELIFRGVLLGLLLNYYGQGVAIVVSAVIFGLWHVLPTLKDLENNDAMTKLLEKKPGFHNGSVIITVLVTGMAGVALGWLRIASGSIVAPWVVHTSINAIALGSGYIITRKTIILQTPTNTQRRKSS